MELVDLLTPDGVVAASRASSKKQLLQDLARKAAEITGADERAIFDVVLERERLGSTGVGNGIAIPHGKLPGLELKGVQSVVELLELHKPSSKSSKSPQHPAE